MKNCSENHTNHANLANLANHAKGALMGQFVGDSSGATLEFFAGTISERRANKAMHMPGGGALSVGPGQITDDSELAIHLLNALHDKNPHKEFPIAAIAKEYIKWHKSNPFDIGKTCGHAFGLARNASQVLANTLRYNVASEANGSLMRITPLAIWARARSCSPDVIIGYARLEALLSHCNPICQDANAVYCLAMVHLLNHPKDNKGAVDFVVDHLHKISTRVRTLVLDTLKADNTDHIVATRNAGHVQHALQLAFYFLKSKTSFEDAIRLTLMKGGDTDTNAAIVGALMGALHGLDAIPEYMVTPVLAWDPTTVSTKSKLGHARPSTYKIVNAMKTLETMLACNFDS